MPRAGDAAREDSGDQDERHQDLRVQMVGGSYRVRSCLKRSGMEPPSGSPGLANNPPRCRPLLAPPRRSDAARRAYLPAKQLAVRKPPAGVVQHGLEAAGAARAHPDRHVWQEAGREEAAKDGAGDLFGAFRQCSGGSVRLVFARRPPPKLTYSKRLTDRSTAKRDQRQSTTPPPAGECTAGSVTEAGSEESEGGGSVVGVQGWAGFLCPRSARQQPHSRGTALAKRALPPDCARGHTSRACRTG